VRGEERGDGTGWEQRREYIKDKHVCSAKKDTKDAQKIYT